MTESITEFRGPTRWLSNFEYAKVTINDKTYATNEHYYQACKALTNQGHETIRTCATPGEAKKLGQQVLLRPDWEEVKDAVMLKGLRAKFAPGTPLAYRLLATKDRLLVEGNNWHDRHWGVCICMLCDRTGLNTLGRLLMQVREELRQTMTLCEAIFEIATEGGCEADSDLYFCGRQVGHEGGHADPTWPTFKP